MAISVLWSFIYHPSIGILNSFLNAVGLSALAHPWLGDGGTALAAIAGMAIWQAGGFYMVLFIAGMQSIPETFYEAAKMDGAGMMFPVFMAVVPLFFLLKDLSLLNTYQGLVLIYVGFSMPFSVFFLTGFFKTLPEELAEAAICEKQWWTCIANDRLARPGHQAVAVR